MPVISYRPSLVAPNDDKKEEPMDREPIITLHCIRKDGRRETTNLREHPISDARELAHWVLHMGNGLYTEVEICIGDRIVEKVQSASMAETVWMT